MGLVLRVGWVIVGLALGLLAGCEFLGPHDYGCQDGCTSDAGLFDAGPGLDGSGSFQVVTWNVEWLGDTDPTHGPVNDPLQQASVRDVMLDAGADVYGLEEVVDPAALAGIIAGMPGFDGFEASDPRVSGGASGYSSWEQKPALVYRTSVVSVVSARAVLELNTYNFAYRPPLEVVLRVTKPGGTLDLTLLVLHMKASTSYSDWQRRVGAAAELKSWLDNNHPADNVMVIGDWNDDLDQSTAWDGGYLPSPYENLLQDPAAYTFVTEALTDAGLRTTVSYPNAIDHQLVTNELAGRPLPDTIEVIRPDRWARPVPSYGDTTSDHYPVSVRYSVEP